jgi:hypothetical protein
MSSEAKMKSIRRRIRGWLFFILCGVIVIAFGEYMDKSFPGIKDSIVAVGTVWTLASVLFLLVNLAAYWMEKKKD